MTPTSGTASKSRTDGQCPVHEFQSLISGKYKLRIIWDLREGPLRYNEIRRGLLRGKAGALEIAARVLSRELKMLTEMKVIRRIDYQQIPPRVEYELTASGARLIPVIGAMHDWSVEHLRGRIEAAA